MRNGVSRLVAVPPAMSDREQRRVALIQVTTVHPTVATRKLAALVRRDPRTGNPREKARRVLQLDESVEMDEDLMTALLALFGEAEAAGQARTLGELGAYFLRKPGVLDRLGWNEPDRERYFTDARGRRMPGLNWGRPTVNIDESMAEGRTDRPTVRLDTTRIGLKQLDEDGVQLGSRCPARPARNSRGGAGTPTSGWPTDSAV